MLYKKGDKVRFIGAVTEEGWGDTNSAIEDSILQIGAVYTVTRGTWEKGHDRIKSVSLNVGNGIESWGLNQLCVIPVSKERNLPQWF